MFRETGGVHTLPSAEEGPMLLARVKRGDEQAMALLYDRYGRLVYSVALCVLRDKAAAEDVLQEIFLQLSRSPGPFCAARGRLGGGLPGVPRTRPIDALPGRRPREPMEEVALASPCNLGEESERNLMM